MAQKHTSSGSGERSPWFTRVLETWHVVGGVIARWFPSFLTDFCLRLGAGMEIRKEHSIILLPHVLPANSSFRKITLVSVYLSAKTGRKTLCGIFLYPPSCQSQRSTEIKGMIHRCYGSNGICCYLGAKAQLSSPLLHLHRQFPNCHRTSCTLKNLRFIESFGPKFTGTVKYFILGSQV